MKFHVGYWFSGSSICLRWPQTAIDVQYTQVSALTNTVAYRKVGFFAGRNLHSEMTYKVIPCLIYAKAYRKMSCFFAERNLLDMT